MVDQITISPKQPCPCIRRETITIDGQQYEQVRGNCEYVHLRLPVGTRIRVEVRDDTDGTLLHTLGPATATAQPGKDPMADVRYRIWDDRDPAPDPVPEPEVMP